MTTKMTAMGDKLIVSIPVENRSWGYKPFEDGTEVTFVAYAKIAYTRINNHCQDPGIYANTHWMVVEDAFGNQHTMGTWNFSRSDGQHVVVERRRLSDLPETEFYEGDVVFAADDSRSYEIARIDYDGRETRDDFDDGISYVLDLGSGSQVTVSSDAPLELVSEGLVRQYAQGRLPPFEDPFAEAEFLKLVGAYDERRNANTGHYAWTRQEAEEAILCGDADWFEHRRGASVHPIRFRDREAGERVRQAMMDEIQPARGLQP